MRWIAALLLAGSLFPLRAAFADDDAVRISTNPDFAGGLTGWQTNGAVRIAKSPRSTNTVVTIGPGPGSIAQHIQTGAANHLMVSAIIHAEPAGIAVLTVRCLNQAGRELMRLESPADIRPGKEPDSLSDYFRPHPLTTAIEISVSSTQPRGSVTVDRLELDIYKDDDPALRSTQDADELLVPFWQGKRVFREAVLLTSTGQQPATGTLMFRPTRILSITSYDGAIQYQQGADYTVIGRTLAAAAGSRISRVRDEDMLHTDLAWNVIGGKQVLVTYEHDDAWTGSIQHSVIDALPNTLAKLRARQPLRIVAYGDSITYGLGSSHMQKFAPWQPPWIDLFTSALKKNWQDPDITLFNASQSGANSDWARQMAGRMVVTINPDLVIVAFGQNDFWDHCAAAFSQNIAAVLSTVRAANPNAEFLLVSTMRFDPAYSLNPAYWNLVTQYDDALRAMTGRGMQLVDMTAITGAVFAAKEPRDCLNDPLHPNDYLSRWYAQSMLAALAPGAAQAASSGSGNKTGKKGVGDDDKDAPEAIDATRSRWYYNWTPRRSTGAIRAEFVPMLWGATSVDSDLAAAVASGGKELLAFNEPDSESEGNVTVDQAIALWPKIEATGLRLGSPATTTGSPWIDQFMDKAKQKNLRVDFLCLHWYGDITAPNAVDELQKYLQSYWDRYHLPVWLTEYSGADFSFHLRHTTTEDNAAFAAASAAMMDKLPFVERYAWFGTQWTPESKDYPTSGLYDNSTHALTPVGIAWRDANSGQP